MSEEGLCAPMDIFLHFASARHAVKNALPHLPVLKRLFLQVCDRKWGSE